MIGWVIPLSEAQSHNLLIADDHPLFRGALREAVSGLFGRADIGEAGTFEEITEQLERGGDIDLILLDLSMPGVRGFSGLMYLRAQYPSLPIVVVSANDDPAVIRRCMEFGASGFIPKTLGIDAMRAAIARGAGRRSVDAARRRSSSPSRRRDRGDDRAAVDADPQQVRVLMMLSGGLLNKQIADELGVSEATVRRTSPRSCKSSASKPDPGRDRCRQNRSWPMAASAGAGKLTIRALLGAQFTTAKI